MSIFYRYTFDGKRHHEGAFCLYTDHLTDKQAALDAQQAAHAEEVDRLMAELKIAEARAVEGNLACDACDWMGSVSECKHSEGEAAGRCDCPECEGDAEGAFWWRDECRERDGEIELLNHNMRSLAGELGCDEDSEDMLLAIKKLTAARDALGQGMDQANADTEETRKEMVQWREWCIKAHAERDAAVRERDAACEALRFYAEQRFFEFNSTAGTDVMTDRGEAARAALAKIEGRRG